MVCFSRFIILQSVVTRYLFVQKVVNCCKCIKAKKIETKTIVIILIGVVYLMFYSYDSILVEPIQCNRIAVSDAEGLSEKEIVNKILIREFDHYKSERLFTKNKIFDN